MVPLQIGLIPMAQVYGRDGLFGSLTGVVLYHIGFGLPFATFLMRNFFTGIPHDLLEAARLDGAGELRLFLKVVLPLGLPAVASLAVFEFLWTCNDLLVALVFAGPDTRPPITVAIQQQTRQFRVNIDVIAPGAFLSMIVPLLVFFVFQRSFAQGLLAGAGKCSDGRPGHVGLHAQFRHTLAHRCLADGQYRAVIPSRDPIPDAWQRPSAQPGPVRHEVLAGKRGGAGGDAITGPCWRADADCGCARQAR